MRAIELPEFEDDDDGEKEAEYVYEKLNMSAPDYKVWRTLGTVDSMLRPYGLEVTFIDNGDMGYFGIAKIEETVSVRGEEKSLSEFIS